MGGINFVVVLVVVVVVNNNKDFVDESSCRS